MFSLPKLRYTRQADDQWVLTDLSSLGATLRLSSIGCDLPLSEIYARVEFAADPEISSLEIVSGDV